MSQIGFVRQQKISIKGKDGKEEIRTWLECHFRVGGIRPFAAKMVKNKKKAKDSEPDFHIYLRANVNKGDNFRDTRIGALWMKTKVFDVVEKTFMTGNVFMNFMEIPIAVWKAEPRFDGEAVNYLYDISMMKDKEQEDRDDPGYTVTYEDAAPLQNGTPSGEAPLTDANGEEIPF